MRSRTVAGEFDVNTVVDLNCDPDLSPERQAEARKLLHGLFGPLAEPMLRACGHAAATRRELVVLQAQVARLAGGPQLRGIVTGIHNGHVRLLLGGGERLLNRPTDFVLGIGQTALTDAEGRTVVAAGDFLIGGQSYVFCERLEERHALVRPLRDGPHDEVRQLALVSDGVDLNALTPGDHVLGWSLDYGNVVLLTRRLGAPHAPVADDAGFARVVSRADIIGLDDVLEQVELLFLDAPSPAYEALLGEASRALVGFVFHGVHGSGKTLVADYLVSTVRQRGGRALYRMASHYLSKWVGEGAGNLRADFEMLEAAYAESGVRPLLVIDELEAIAVDRTHPWALSGGHLDVLDTLLGLLTRSKARMIGISNLADRVLDAALLRDGRLPILRFPATIDAPQVEALVARCLRRAPLAGEGRTADDAPRAFGETVSDLIFSPGSALAELLRVQLADGRLLTFGACDLTTPAAIADGIVRPTLARAAQRDLRAGRPAPWPLTVAELRTATVQYFVERCATITRDNLRSVLPDTIPEDQAIAKVERLAVAGAPNGRQ